MFSCVHKWELSIISLVRVMTLVSFSFERANVASRSQNASRCCVEGRVYPNQMKHTPFQNRI